MPKEILVYRGWIGAKESDRDELEKLGVEVDGYNPIGAFDRCRMPASSYDKFVRAWKGRGVWGMIARKELAYTPEDDVDIPF
jgi:hypothetical protein